MSGFRDLAQVSRELLEVLQEQSQSLEVVTDMILPPEDTVHKKMEYLSLMTSKLSLLNGCKNQSSTDVRSHSDGACDRLPETITDRLINDNIVRSAVMYKTIKDFFKQSPSQLGQESLDSRDELVNHMNELTALEDQLLALDERLRERQELLHKLRLDWNSALERISDHERKVAACEDETNMTPERTKMKSLLERMEMMRVIIGRLLVTRNYDWTADNDRLVKMLVLTRQVNQCEDFLH